METKRLDSVMNLVGELVLGRNRLIKIGTQLEQNHESDPQVRALGETLAQLNLVTTDLQLAVMKTRMLPIKKSLRQAAPNGAGSLAEARKTGAPRNARRGN
ncbi:MAG: hypothetical protein U0231_15770 [Nitrospiraceae bacterium]